MASTMSMILTKSMWLILLLKGLQGRKCYLDTSDFNRLLSESDCFVDKTELIKEIIENPAKMIAITAPPNFGKTVNMDTLKTFLENRKNSCELFKSKNLSIFRDHRQFFDEHCGRYSVVYADFKSVVGATFVELSKKFRATIRESFSEHTYLLKSDRLNESLKNEFLLYHSGPDRLNETELISALSRLSALLRIHHSPSDTSGERKKVFALIDNYDYAFSNLNFDYRKTDLEEDMQKYFIFLMNAITDLVEYNEGNLAGALITGRLQLHGIGTIYARNVAKYPFLDDEKFARFYGLTTDEVKKLADKFAVDRRTERLEDWYNGYRTAAGNTSTGNRSAAVKIYSVRSVLNYLQTGTYDAYWTNNPRIANPDYWQKLFLQPSIRPVMIDLLDGNDRNVTEMHAYTAQEFFNLEETLNEPTAPNRTYYYWTKILQFMTDYGYFNVLRRSQTEVTDRLRIAVPNLEIYKTLYSRLYGKWFYETNVKFDQDKIDSYCRALNSDELITVNGESIRKSAFLRLKNSIGTLFGLRNNDDDAAAGRTTNESIVTLENEHSFLSALYHAANRCRHHRLFDIVAVEPGEKHDGKKRRNDLTIIRKDGAAIIVNAKYNEDHSSAEAALGQIIAGNKSPDKMEKYEAKVRNRIYIDLYVHGPKRIIHMNYLINSTNEKDHFSV